MNWATLLTRLSHLPALACLRYKRDLDRGTGPMHRTRPWSSPLRALQKAAVGGPRSRQAGRAVGFMTFIEEGPVWWGRFPGFDYSVAPQVYLYFNLLFYHPIQLAINRGITSLAYSMGSYETKCSRGCSLRNFLAYVRVPDDAVRSHLAVIDRVQRRRFERIGRMHTKGVPS